MRIQGFTLIEIIVSVGIIAVIATLALPSYSDYVRRGRLAEAFDALGAYKLRMEQAYQDGGNYGVTACAVGVPASTSNYQYSCTLSNAGQGFAAAATGIGSMTGFTFTTDAAGINGTTQFRGTAVVANCWLTRSGEC